MISQDRPSGSTVYTDVTVKIFPDALQAARVFHRHNDNPEIAVPVIIRSNEVLIMKTGNEIPPGERITVGDLTPMLIPFWEKECMSFEPATKPEYVAYVLRDKKLPAKMRSMVLDRCQTLSPTPTAKQIHGDLTRDNIVAVDGRIRFIDFSIRKEMPYWESDTAKFKFHDWRTSGKLPELSRNESFFFATHFCRVWTRDVKMRSQLGESFDDYLEELSLMAEDDL